tara:strand:+ start:1510 stop:1704 length:195 start_codon:yes stop_codon:yes gene_type:complete
MDFINRPVKISDINNEQRRIGELTLENDKLRQSIQQQSQESSTPKDPEISKAKEWIEQGGSIHC